MSPDLLEQSQEWLTSMNRIFRSRQRVEARDFLIEAADLEEFGEPERGDRVMDTLNGKVELFEVMAPGGEPHFRYSDPYRKVFRIHTKHVGTESAE